MCHSPCCGFTALLKGKENIDASLLEPETHEHIGQTETPILEPITLSLNLVPCCFLSARKTNQIIHWGPENFHSFAYQLILVPFTLKGCKMVRDKVIPTEALSPSPQRIKTDPAATVASFLCLRGLLSIPTWWDAISPALPLSVT